MITVNVVCIGKNARLEGEKIVTDITFQPEPAGSPAGGAQMGVPDPNAQGGLTEVKETIYTLTSGGFSINVKDSKVADTYQIGEVYPFGVTSAKK